MTVKTAPTGRTCSVVGGSGSVNSGNVTSVAVVCSVNAYTVGGTVSGLSGTLVLQNNAADDLTLTANGAFTFATPVASGATYAVTVKTKPAGYTCVVSNGTGDVSAANVTNVTIACTNTYSVGGTVSGLTGTLVLQNNNTDNLTITQNGVFSFATHVVHNGAYSVTVLTQPAGQYCTPTSNSGTINGAAVTSVSVTCMTSKLLFVTAETHNGSLGGVAGADAFCAASASKPNGSTYKALIVSGADRVACTSANCATGGLAEHVDWVLTANTPYYRADGTTLIGITNANGLWNLPLTNTYKYDVGTHGAPRIWAGLTTSWTNDGFHCSGWTTGLGTNNGAHMRADAVNNQAVYYSSEACIDSNYLACVEQ